MTRTNVAENEPLFDFAAIPPLLAGDIRDLYLRTIERAKIGKLDGVRIRLRLQDPLLVTFPWEYLKDPRTDDYLCLSKQTPLVRYVETSAAPVEIPVSPPLSILGVISAPTDLPWLDVEDERKKIDRATAPLRQANLLDLTWAGGSTPRDLLKALRKGRFHILHFVGHGDFDAASNEGTIALTDNSGKALPVKATDLARWLGDHEPLRMVVLNSCLGAKGGVTLFSSTASILSARGIPAVVAMQYAISDDAAKAFAGDLYDSIADKQPIDAAITDARNLMQQTPACADEWVTPVLHMRSSDGVLFKLQGDGVSDLRARGEYDERGQSAPPPDSISAALLPMFRWALAAVSVIAVSMILSWLIVVGTDERLGSDFRAAQISHRWPVFRFVGDALLAILGSAGEHYVIAGLGIAVVSLASYLLLPRPAESPVAKGLAGLLQRIRNRAGPLRRQILATLTMVAAIAAILLVAPARGITHQLEQYKLADASLAKGTTGRLAQAQACRALRDHELVVKKLELDCVNKTPDLRASEAQGRLRDWLATVAILVVLSLSGSALLRTSMRVVGLQKPGLASRALYNSAQGMSAIGLGILAIGYGIVNRPVNPPFSTISTPQVAQLCSGYVLSNRTLYNPTTGVVDSIPPGGDPHAATDGLIHDIIRDRLLYDASGKDFVRTPCKAAASAPRAEGQ